MSGARFLNDTPNLFFDGFPKEVEEVGGESIRARSFPFIQLEDCLFHLSKSGGFKQNLVVFFHEQFRYMLGDFSYSLMPLMTGFVEYVLEVVAQLLRDILLLFQSLPIQIFEDCDSVVHPVLNGGSMEKLCVSFSIFEPTYPIFLFA